MSARSAVQRAGRAAHGAVARALGVDVSYRGPGSGYDPATGTETPATAVTLRVQPVEIGVRERTADTRLARGAYRFEVSQADFAAVRSGPPSLGDRFTVDGVEYEVHIWFADDVGVHWTVTGLGPSAAAHT